MSAFNPKEIRSGNLIEVVNVLTDKRFVGYCLSARPPKDSWGAWSVKIFDPVEKIERIFPVVSEFFLLKILDNRHTRQARPYYLKELSPRKIKERLKRQD